MAKPSTSQRPRSMSAEPSIAKPQSISPRKQQIVEIAARLFARNGYRGTSIRDIGKEAGVLGGSLYHHIVSKDALFVDLHNGALDAAAEAIATAVDKEGDPWKRLEAACIAMLEIELDPDSITLPLMRDYSEVPSSVQRQLLERRDEFEEIFRALIADLPLPSQIDRSVYRNGLLSLLNAAGDWYRPGRLTPAEIGRQIVRIFTHS
jgi:TetR/AcrR family transcriptional regulator, cholesterol catabolism regulator